MKGIELPISTLIIIIIALLLLLALLAFFWGVWNPGKGSINLETAKDNACNMLVGTSCNQNTWNVATRDFDANKNGNLNDAGGIAWNQNTDCGPLETTSGDNLAALCVCYYSFYNDNDCKQILCGCKT